MAGGEAQAAARRGLLAAVAMAIFCVDVDFFALNLALPATARDLHVTTTNLQWAIAVYQLTLASFLTPGGRLGDLLGRKRVLLIGIGIFGFASLLCGASQSATMLIAARFVQGTGAAMLFPVGISVISNAFPVAERGRAIGNVYGVGAIGTAVGPFIGGVLTDAIDWRWVFFFNVPFAVGAFLLTLRHVRESRDTSAERIDFAGLIAVTAGIAAFTYAIDRGGAWGWLSARTLGLAAIGIALLAGFLFIETRVRFALVDLDLFRNLPYVLVTAAGAVGNTAFCLTLFLSTIYLQQVRGLSPLMAGVVFLGPALANAGAGVLAGRLGARGSLPHRVIGCALAIGALALFGLSIFTAWPWYISAFTLAGFGLGIAWAYTSVGTQAVVPEAMAGGASGVTLAVAVGSGGLAVVVGATLLEVLTAHGETTTGAIHDMSLVLAAMSALAAVALAASGGLIRARAATPEVAT
ncbi:MAG TPA: MFS transporter [Solirubrobacteraceae bacterium]|nr:MFS transporter [Solirubrobacteraceae bacterium]